MLINQNDTSLYTSMKSVIFSTVFIFFSFYNISFEIFPSFSTARIALITLILLYIFNPRKTYKLDSHLLTNFAHISVLGFMIFHLFVFIILGSINDYTQLTRLINYIVLVIVGSFLYLNFFKGRYERFLQSVLLATFIQAIFIFISYFSLEFRVWTSEYLVEGGNIGFLNSFRVAGFSNSSGANLSIIQSLGVFSGLYLIFNYKKNIIVSIVFLVIIFLSMVFVGRTGLVFSCVFFVYFVLKNIKSFKKLVAITIMLTLLSIAFVRFEYLILEFNDSYSYNKQWVSSVFTGEDDTLNALVSNQDIPRLDFYNMFIGNGVIVDKESGLNASGHDSGYIQTYYAVGFIFCSLFYISLFYTLFKNIHISRQNLDLYFLLICMFLMELKEPFIFKYTISFFVWSSFIFNSPNKVKNYT